MPKSAVRCRPDPMLKPLIALAAALAMTAGTVRAADVRLERGSKGAQSTPIAFLWVSGEITPGDTARVSMLLAEARKQDRPFFAVYLDSPGGNLMEGIKLGQAIREAGAVTVLLTGATCASACILAFAGGAERIAYRGSRLGVHGASENGQETEGRWPARSPWPGSRPSSGCTTPL